MNENKQVLKGFEQYNTLKYLCKDIEEYGKENNLVVVDIAFSAGIRYYHAIVTYRQSSL